MLKRISPQLICRKLRTPTAAELAAQIIQLLNYGEITKGCLLPTVNELAGLLNIHPHIILNAWKLLLDNHLISGNEQSGFTIIATSSFNQAPKQKTLIDLSHSIPDPTLLPKLAEAVKNAIEVEDLNHSYRADIIPALQQAISANWPYQPDGFIAMNNLFDTLFMLVNLLSNNRSDYIVIEQPSTIGVIELLQHVNKKIITIKSDEEGPIPIRLIRALKKYQPAIFIFQPRVVAPSGVNVSQKRLEKLARALEQHHAWIIELDLFGDLATVSPQSLATYLPQRTIHLRSYIKAYGADVGLTLLSTSSELLQKIQDSRSFNHLGWSSRLLQQTLAWLIQNPQTQATVAHARKTYLSRQQSLARALLKHEVVEHIQGDYFSLWLPVRSETLISMALKEQGILVTTSDAFCIKGCHHIRLSTSLLDEQQADNIAKTIANIIHPAFRSLLL